MNVIQIWKFTAILKNLKKSIAGISEPKIPHPKASSENDLNV